MTPGDLLRGRSDDLTSWIRLDLPTRRIVGRRLEQGASPALDEALDKLMMLRAWAARRLVN
jgi:hypothetical protein